MDSADDAEGPLHSREKNKQGSEEVPRFEEVENAEKWLGEATDTFKTFQTHYESNFVCPTKVLS